MASKSADPSRSQPLGSRVKRAAFGTVKALLRVDPTGRVEQGVQQALLQRFRDDPSRLQSLAWHAEEQGDPGLALLAWQAIAECQSPRGETTPRQQAKTYSKLARIETHIRRQVAFYRPDLPPVFDAAVTPPPDPADFADQPEPAGLPRQHQMLKTFWADVLAWPEVQQALLCTGFADLAMAEDKAGHADVALSARHPIQVFWSDYTDASSAQYSAVLGALTAAYGTAGSDTELSPSAEVWEPFETWWAALRADGGTTEKTTLRQVWQLSLVAAQSLQKEGHHTAAERLIQPAFDLWDDNAAGLPVLASAAEERKDWRRAAIHWQLYAAIMNPVSTKSGTIKAKNAETRTRRANFGRAGLRRVRVELAREALAQGQNRTFGELVPRIIESLPDHRLLKFDADLLDVTRLYVQRALREDGAYHSPVLGTGGAAVTGGLRRVVLALDILKVSEVHTHSRVIFTMCRNLLTHDQDLEIHVVVTNERFAVTTPVVGEAFSPTRNQEVTERARAALGDLFGTRFHLDILHDTGLEGVVSAARHILDLAPDLVLYGGGHRGLFSNESRLVRHVLYDLLPAAFFYIQANNEVDPKFDMIITRGPHEVGGDPGKAQLREQPYPTIVDAALEKAQSAVNPDKFTAKRIVSAITGVRMDLRLSEMGTTEEGRAEMATFFSILDRVPGAVWHFIGCTDSAAVKKANSELARRVAAGQVVLHKVLPFETFTDLVGNASLFLHLPGFTGGSGGAAVARRGAIPILTFNHSDVSGRQPPETIFEEDDRAGFADLAVALLSDCDRWSQVAQSQIDHTQWIRETSVTGFHDCLRDAAQLGRTRLAQAQLVDEH